MEKKFISTQKYLVMGPRKLRFVAAIAKKLSPAVAVEKLPFVARRASEPLVKSIKAALSQARSAGIADSDIVFSEIQISEGPRLKRGRAASRGRYHPFKHRMSHIRVVLKAKIEKKVEKKAAEVKEEKPKKVVRKGVKSGTKN